MVLSSKGLEEGVITPPDDDMKPVPGQLGGLPNSEAHRGLSSRHVQFLALGGCIGTGLFVGSGQSLSTVGPGKLVVWIYFRGRVYYRTCRKLHCTVRWLSRTNSFSSAFTHGIYCHVYCRVFHHEYAGRNDHLPAYARCFRPIFHQPIYRAKPGIRHWSAVSFCRNTLFWN
jgi:hypothetical protein